MCGFIIFTITIYRRPIQDLLKKLVTEWENLMNHLDAHLSNNVLTWSRKEIPFTLL